MIKVANISSFGYKVRSVCKQTAKNSVGHTGVDKFVRSSSTTAQQATKPSSIGHTVPGVLEPALPDKEFSGSLRRIYSLLNKYARRMRRENRFDPKELNRILTSYMGEGKELVFYITPEKGIYQGRKRLFTAFDGRQYILEAHDSTKYGLAVRLSQVRDSAGKQFSEKEYIYLGVINGQFKFASDKHYDKLFHLPPTENVLEWIRGGKCKMGNH